MCIITFSRNRCLLPFLQPYMNTTASSAPVQYSESVYSLLHYRKLTNVAYSIFIKALTNTKLLFKYSLFCRIFHKNSKIPSTHPMCDLKAKLNWLLKIIAHFFSCAFHCMSLQLYMCTANASQGREEKRMCWGCSGSWDVFVFYYWASISPCFHWKQHQAAAHGKLP